MFCHGTVSLIDLSDSQSRHNNAANLYTNDTASGFSHHYHDTYGVISQSSYDRAYIEVHNYDDNRKIYDYLWSTSMAHKVAWSDNIYEQTTIWSNIVENKINYNSNYVVTQVSDSSVVSHYHNNNGDTYIYPTQIRTPEVIQTSQEKDKKDFKKFTGALDELKNIDIYQYHLKNESKEDKKHLGFVIGDKYNYSEVVTSKDNEGVDVYSFVSLCCKAIQEQQEQIESLKEQVNQLERKIKNV